MRFKKICVVFASVAVLAMAGSAFAAANPFADVPQGNWAYDAVAQLAADGIVAGYPDGAFKGAQPATRYEVASVVARALAKVDVTKANKQDLEMLKKLTLEFKDELDALGVKVDKIDGRVAALEEGVGGWKLTGNFVFDAKWDDEDGAYNLDGNKNQFEFADAHINLAKTIDEKNSVFTRFTWDRTANMYGITDNNVKIDRMYWNGALSDKWNVRVGRQAMDWELDEGLRNANENDSWLNSWVYDGFRVNWTPTAKFGAEVFAARNLTTDNYPIAQSPVYTDAGLYGLKLRYQPSEKFWVGGVLDLEQDDNDDVAAGNIHSYGAFAGWNPWQNVGLRGFYYKQDIDNFGDDFDSPSAWKAALTLDQKLLKYTSVWAEYGKVDKGYMGSLANAYAPMNDMSSIIVRPNVDFPGLAFDTKLLLVRLDQKWNDKWSSFERYAVADYDVPNFDADKVKNWTLGVQYQYTPAVAFQLAYDNVDYGNMKSLVWTNNNSELFSGNADETDHIVRFRTTVNF